MNDAEQVGQPHSLLWASPEFQGVREFQGHLGCLEGPKWAGQNAGIHTVLARTKLLPLLYIPKQHLQMHTCIHLISTQTQHKCAHTGYLHTDTCTNTSMFISLTGSPSRPAAPGVPSSPLGPCTTVRGGIHVWANTVTRT